MLLFKSQKQWEPLTLAFQTETKKAHHSLFLAVIQKFGKALKITNKKLNLGRGIYDLTLVLKMHLVIEIDPVQSFTND